MTLSSSTLSPETVASRCAAGNVFILDVRTPIEFDEVHATFAKNVPLDRLDAARIKSDFAPNGGPVYVICKTGGRGQKACDKLAAAGLEVVNVQGGTTAWVAAGLPVVRGRSAVSLERQVRIAAGSIVLLGVALGFLVHPALFGIAGFVGAGLVFAGVTDWCGMGLMLAKMPWNQRSAGAACATVVTESK